MNHLYTLYKILAILMLLKNNTNNAFIRTTSAAKLADVKTQLDTLLQVKINQIVAFDTALAKSLALHINNLASNSLVTAANAVSVPVGAFQKDLLHSSDNVINQIGNAISQKLASSNIEISSLVNSELNRVKSNINNAITRLAAQDPNTIYNILVTGEATDLADGIILGAASNIAARIPDIKSSSYDSIQEIVSSLKNKGENDFLTTSANFKGQTFLALNNVFSASVATLASVFSKYIEELYTASSASFIDFGSNAQLIINYAFGDSLVTKSVTQRRITSLDNYAGLHKLRRLLEHPFEI